MGKLGFDLYYPDISVKATRVLECYKDLLGEITECAKREDWELDFWHSIIIATTIDLIREMVNIQSDLMDKALEDV